jgi:ribosomal protein S18 acetylase RimI-like enzyme
MRAYRETISKAKEDYFDKKFGDSQLYLTTLATHPHYMRRGAGAALCDWGIKKAVSDKLAAVTLFSSPMGIPLYTKLGFQQVGIVHTQVDGEEDFIDFPGMTLEPRSFVLRSRNLETAFGEVIPRLKLGSPAVGYLP